MTLYTFLFLVGFKRKKIQKVEPDEFLDYFKNLVSYEKSKQLELVSVARLICYLTIQNESHNVHFFCHCFSCRICRVLLSVLCKRDYQKLLLTVNKNVML